MGSNNSASTSNISIEFSEKNKSVYQTGESIEGIIHFNNNDNLEFDVENCIIELIGELIYTSYKRQGSSTIVTTEEIHFFSNRIVLHSDNEKNRFILKNSNNKWKFSFCLSNELPSSFEQIHLQGPFIHYFIRIRGLSNHLKKELKKDFPIVVQRPLQRINSIPFQIQNTNRKNLHCNVSLENNLAIIGQQLPIQIHLYNPNRLAIQRISLALVQLRKLGPIKEERQVLFKQNLKHFHHFQDENYNENFQIDIPYGINPSCSYYLLIKSLRWLIFLQYELHIKVHINGIKTSISLTVPLVINKTIDQTIPSIIDPTVFDLDQSQA